MRIRSAAAAATIATLVALLVGAGAQAAPRGLVPAGPAITPPLPASSWIDAFDSDNRSRLVVLDVTGVEVVTMDAAGRVLARWATSPGPTDRRPLGGADVSVAASGEIAVSRVFYGQVERYTPDGQLLEIVRHRALEHPQSVEYTDDGSLIVRASTTADPRSQLYRLLPGGEVQPLAVVPPGGQLSSAGARLWLTAIDTVVALLDRRPALIIGAGRRDGTSDQGDFGWLGLSDAAGDRDGVWVTDGSTVQRFAASGALRLSCHPDLGDTAPALLAVIGQTLYVSTTRSIHPVRLSRRPSPGCATARLRMTRVRLRTRRDGMDRVLRLRFHINHRARVDAVLVPADPDRCLARFCDERPLPSFRVRRGSRTLTYRVPARELASGGPYVLRVAARSAGQRARADVSLLPVPAEYRLR